MKKKLISMVAGITFAFVSLIAVGGTVSFGGTSALAADKGGCKSLVAWFANGGNCNPTGQGAQVLKSTSNGR